MFTVGFLLCITTYFDAINDIFQFDGILKLATNQVKFSQNHK